MYISLTQKWDGRGSYFKFTGQLYNFDICFEYFLRKLNQSSKLQLFAVQCTSHNFQVKLFTKNVTYN